MARQEKYTKGSIFNDPFGGKGELIDLQPGYALWAWCNELTGEMHTCEQSEIDPILEENQRRRNASQGNRWGDGQVVASIPNALLYGDSYYAKARAAQDTKAMKKFLNDPDNRKLRTFDGTL